MEYWSIQKYVMSFLICYFYAKKDDPYYFTWKNELQYLYLVFKPLNTTISSDFAMKYVFGPLSFRRAVGDRFTNSLKIL